MSTYKIAVFVGSLRAASINLRLARALEKLVPPDFKFDYVNLDVPLFNQDNENNLPGRGQAQAADHRIPGRAVRLARAQSLGARRHQERHRLGLASVGSQLLGRQGRRVLGTSPSAAGTALMQQHLRNILAAEGASTPTTPEVFLQYSDGLVNDQYEITNEGTRKFLQGWIDRYVDWIRKFNA